MRFICLLLLMIVLFTTSSYSDLNEGHKKGQKILFLRANNKQVSETGPENMAWIANKFNVHHTVVQSATYPADLSSFDQIWDIRYYYGNSGGLTNAEKAKILDYMKNDSGSVFLLGENAGFSALNNKIISIVNTVTKKGGFASSGMGTLSGPGMNLAVDGNACKGAENFNTDFQTGWSKVWTEFPGAVRLDQLAGGYPVLKTTFNCMSKNANGSVIAGWGTPQKGAGAVAFTPDKMKAEYGGSKLFVFFDTQAFHCWASTKWGMSNSHKNNLKFFWNIVDFLTKTVEQATLTADPAGGVYTTGELEVTLTTNADSISYTVKYEEGTKATGTLGKSGVITLTGNDTITATAFGEGVDPKTKTWTYVQELPDAFLTATPSDDPVYVYDADELDVVLETNSTNRIVYQTISGTDTSAWDTTGNHLETVTIQGNVTLSAFTTGINFESVTDSWDYFRKIHPPTIITSPITDITDTDAKGGGEITDDGGAPVTKRGICWSTGAHPDTSDTKTVDGKGSGTFTSVITNIEAKTKYYVRAYAINSEGIRYGNEVEFTSAETPMATLTATPGDTTYDTVELPVTLSTDAGNRIYYTTDGSTPDTTDISQQLNSGKSSGVVTISGDVTIKAIAVGLGYTATSKSWEYDQELPAASLTALPGDTTYTTVDLSVVLVSDSGNSIYYTTDGSAPDATDDSQLLNSGKSSGVVSISGDVTINAIAIGEAYTATSKSWTYKQELPLAMLTASPGDTTYTTGSLVVTLSTDKNNTIYYTTDGTTPDTTDASQLLNEGNHTGEITIRGDVTIRAIAVGEGYTLHTTSWNYVQDLPSLYVKAVAGGVTKGDVSFYFDTTVTLLAEDSTGNVVPDAEILYILDDGNGPLITHENGTVYSDTLSLNKTVRLQALAVHSNFKNGRGEWNYTLLLKENPIVAKTFCHSYRDSSLVSGPKVTMSNDTVAFGTHLKISLESESDSLHYRFSGTEWKVYALGDTLQIHDEYGDMVTIDVKSQGHGYEETALSFTARRDTIKSLTVSPEESGFTSDVVAISADLKGDWVHGKIYVDSTGAFEEYNTQIFRRDSCAFTFEARADFAIWQRIERSFYPIASVEEAYYYDRDGNGAIDSVLIKTNRDDLQISPDSIILLSPVSRQKRKLSSDDIVINGSYLSASFEEFPFDGWTSFKAAELGTVYGKRYTDEMVVIADRVAPVIRSAFYRPGAIVAANPIKRDPDTLYVHYSEEVSIENLAYPVQFFHSDGAYYEMLFEEGALVRAEEERGDSLYSFSKGVFITEEESGYAIPFDKDSVNIAVESKTSGIGTEQQEIDNNRFVALEVAEIPYLLTLTALTPVNPEEDEIPLELQPIGNSITGGIVIEADFNVLLSNDAQDARIAIFDKVGNLVLSMSGINDNGESLFAERREEETTRLLLYWTGQNSSGRLVGAGSYFAIVEIQDGQGKVLTYTIPLGIQTDLK